MWDTSLVRGIQDQLHSVGKASAWGEPRMCEGKAEGSFKAHKSTLSSPPQGI